MDMASIQAAVISLKTAAEIASGLIKIKTASEIQAKVAELNAEIIAAQTSALAANSEQFALLQRVHDLEEEIARVKAWETEKERYRLREISPGAFAYVVKKAAQGIEPPHAICANCYQQGRKSILYWTQATYGTLSFRCSACKSGFDGYSPNDNFRISSVD